MGRAGSGSVDMTTGNIWKLLVAASVPLLLGNLFQQLYNTADSIILGRFVGQQALAAVGSTTTLCNTLIRFFNGISIGAGVIISRDFGEKNIPALQRAVETAMALSVVLGAVVSILALPFVPLLLNMMQTVDELLPEAEIYMRIYVSGILFLFIYNMGGAVLRAVGDNRTPLYALILSSLVNIILDIVLVVGSGMGTAGAAVATVAAEGVSAIVVCAALTHARGPHRLEWRRLHLDETTVKGIFALGLPVGIYPDDPRVRKDAGRIRRSWGRNEKSQYRSYDRY